MCLSDALMIFDIAAFLAVDQLVIIIIYIIIIVIIIVCIVFITVADLPYKACNWTEHEFESKHQYSALLFCN